MYAVSTGQAVVTGLSRLWPEGWKYTHDPPVTVVNRHSAHAFHVDLSTENDVKEAEGWRVRSISIALRINFDSQKPSKKPAMVACVIPELG